MVKKYGAERGKGGVWRAKPAGPSQRLGPRPQAANAACCAGFESNLHAANPKIC